MLWVTARVTGTSKARRPAGCRSLAVYCFSIYNKFVIRSFGNAETEKIFNEEFSRQFQAIQGTALRKLLYLNQ
jgi:hypothetical protein